MTYTQQVGRAGVNGYRFRSKSWKLFIGSWAWIIGYGWMWGRHTRRDRVIKVR